MAQARPPRIVPTQLRIAPSALHHWFVTVRTAYEGDAKAIGSVHVRSWQAIYRGEFPQDFLEGLDPDHRAERWSECIRSGPHEGSAILVVESGGEVIGFANVGPSRDDDAPAGEGEVRAIYLMPEHWGHGHGRQLMAAALDHLRQTGFSEAILWVLGSNQQARRFYEIGGWASDGASKDDDSFGFRMSEVRYRRRVA